MGNDLIHAAQYADGMLADMGNAPLSRRGFAAAGLLAASAAVFGLPEGFGLTTQKAWADTTYGVDVGDALNNHIIRIRPEGFWNMANVHYDGSGVGDVCQLYGIGTSSKHQVLYDGSKGAYHIHAMSNFEENEWCRNSIWDIDGRSTKEDAVVHVWYDDVDGVNSRLWRFYRDEETGLYYIKNLNSGHYLTLEQFSKDKKSYEESDYEGHKLAQGDRQVDGHPMAWELEITGNGTDGKSTTSCGLWTQYSTFTKSPYWMSELPDELLLTDLSIPGTHDSGTCSVNNDEAPQVSSFKTQQDYIPAQLLEGARYFDIRLGDGDDPCIHHGPGTTLTKAGTDQHFSDLMGYLISFLKDQADISGSETIILLLSADSEGQKVRATNSLRKYIDDDRYSDMFWLSSDRVPTLGEARGKIVLLLRFEPLQQDENYVVTPYTEKALGIDLAKWSDNDYKSKEGLLDITSFGNGSCSVTVCAQDHYQVLGSTKKDYVDGALDEAASIHKDDAGQELDHPVGTYCLNYSSCTGSIESIPDAARTVNSWLFDDLESGDHASSYTDVVVSDYTDSHIARSVYSRNEIYLTHRSPSDIFMVYGDDPFASTVVGGNLANEGDYWRMADPSVVLSANDEAEPHQVVYMKAPVAAASSAESAFARAASSDYSALFRSSVLFHVSQRSATAAWNIAAESPRGGIMGENLKAAVEGFVQNVLENDDVSLEVSFYRDLDGQPGEQVDPESVVAPGTFWVRATKLAGAHARNYELSEDGLTSFYYAGSSASEGESDESGEGGESGKIAGPKNPTASSGESNKADSGEKNALPKTGDNVNAATLLGVTAAAGAVAVIAKTASSEDAEE